MRIRINAQRCYFSFFAFFGDSLCHLNTRREKIIGVFFVVVVVVVVFFFFLRLGPRLCNAIESKEQILCDFVYYL